MIFHIDANSFYASCERLFRPDLKDRPIVVLSNNDGIIVSLSAEAKNLGFRRGDAYFKVAEACDKKGVAVFSSNYTLYADISARLVAIYSRLCPDVEVYSIDECFLYFPDWKCPDFTGIARHLQSTVCKETGIPVSVGIAPTRTLAKLCNKLAKKRDGVLSWAEIDGDAELARIPVGDVWGIGWSKKNQLERNGIRTARELKSYPLDLAKKNLTITGFRTVQELNGIPAIERNEIEKRQNICSSKSFGQAVFSLGELEEALSEYAHEAVSRLRTQKSAVRYVSVYLMTNPWDEAGPQYCNQLSAELSKPTSYLPDILGTSLDLLRRLYRPGYRYRKVMINLLGLEDDAIVQQDLFDADSLSGRAEGPSPDAYDGDGDEEPADRPEADSPQEPAGAENFPGMALWTSHRPGRPGRAQQVTPQRRPATPTRPQRQALMKCFDAINGRYGRNVLRLGSCLISPSAWNMQRKFLSPAYTTDLAVIPVVY